MAVTFEDVREVAATFPHVEEGTFEERDAMMADELERDRLPDLLRRACRLASKPR
jgi:hypothetical protein